MGTKEDLIKSLEWNNNIKNREEKEVLARKIASKVKEGDVISFGSGTTSFLAVKAIGKRCRDEGLHITAIPTSEQIRLLKGLGAALYKEKNNIKQTPIVYILVDKSKLVQRLGEKCPVPVECDKKKIEYVAEELRKLGAVQCNVRKLKNSESILVTENDKYIIDATFDSIDAKMEQKINAIDGVLENGLFINYDNIEIMIA